MPATRQRRDAPDAPDAAVLMLLRRYAIIRRLTRPSDAAGDDAICRQRKRQRMFSRRASVARGAHQTSEEDRQINMRGAASGHEARKRIKAGATSCAIECCR